MTTIEQLKNKIPSYAKDIKLNFSTLLSNTESLPLSETQIAALALAAGYATQQSNVIEALENYAIQQKKVSHQEIEAVKGAASVMAMSNVYYRSVHQIKNIHYADSPSNLRMHILQNHGIAQHDFELHCLVISAINGCGRCVDAHVNVLERKKISESIIQYSIRLAAVVKAVAQVITIEAHNI